TALRRLQHDLFAVVVFVHEHLVALRCVGQRQSMGNDETRIDLALLDPIEQRLHVTLDMALPRADSQSAIDDCSHRKLVDEAPVHSYHRYDAAIATATDGLS